MSEIIERPITGLGIGDDGKPQYYVLMRAERVDEDGYTTIIGNTPLSPPLTEKQMLQLKDQVDGALGSKANQNVQALDGLREFIITFGVQYNESTNPHPQGMHPDGYFVIEAPDSEVARKLAFALFDQSWAFDYDKATYDQDKMDRFHPRGELGRARLTHNLQPLERVE